MSSVIELDLAAVTGFRILMPFYALDEKYKLKKNKGYGTKEHMEGIKKYGISKYHRKTFGICKN